ncbi:MAG: DHH family phosphoesterase [Acidobacteria bacterium]|nr:DHH family phosphoesterase [Acidobacteriota bacterium]
MGDYDVDGVSACALLTAVLRALAVEVVPIIPNRLTDGYGFQVAQVEKARRAGASLIVTVDCGTTSKEAVEEAIRQGMDVVVTDHHVVGSGFPSQAIQVNPQQDGCTYPFRHLCGAGLAFKLAQALLRRSGREEPLAALLRVACLGTIADVVPLVGENRVKRHGPRGSGP